ncbi:Ig heavy chain V region C3, partial [Cuculus canorus]
GLWAQWMLLEAGGGLRAPGDSVLFSCDGLGFSFDTLGHWWYRQAPGSRLESVSYTRHDSSVIQYGPSVQGRATVSQDQFQQKASLTLRALNPKDSARYFCA